MRTTDVLVIGAGPGGYVAAIRAAQRGKKVICVEKEKLGGVCLNVGCIPSKALIHASTVVDRAHDAAEMGIGLGAISVDIQKMVAWKQKVVDRLTGGGVSPVEVCDELIAPVLRRFGERWAAGTGTVIDEHRASAICERLLARMPVRRTRVRGTAVVATPAKEGK